MNQTFSEPEKTLLRMLRAEPAWFSILEKLAPPGVAPWRPDLETKGENQYHSYIYDSGYANGANDLITTLREENAS